MLDHGGAGTVCVGVRHDVVEVDVEQAANDCVGLQDVLQTRNLV